ncbi:MAG: hypothetical protein V3T31_13475, partial [candidate division Zixibacteria bacterium]
MAEVLFPFPLGGLDESGAFLRQPRETTPDCLNVRAYSTDQLRARGGSRPGVDRAFTQRIGGASGAMQWVGWMDWGFGDTVLYEDKFEYADGALKDASGSLWPSANANIDVSAGGVIDGTSPLPDTLTMISSDDMSGISPDDWVDFDLEVNMQFKYGSSGKLELYFEYSATPYTVATIEFVSTEISDPALGFTSVLTIISGSGTWSDNFGLGQAPTGGALRIVGEAGYIRVFWLGKEIISRSRTDHTFDAAYFKIG